MSAHEARNAPAAAVARVEVMKDRREGLNLPKSVEDSFSCLFISGSDDSDSPFMVSNPFLFL